MLENQGSTACLSHLQTTIPRKSNMPQAADRRQTSEHVIAEDASVDERNSIGATGHRKQPRVSQ